MDDPDSPRPATKKRRLDSPTNVSLKSGESTVEPMSFSQQPVDKRRSISPTNISLKSNESIVEPCSFSGQSGGKRRSISPTNIPLKSNESIVEPCSFSGQSGFKRAKDELVDKPKPSHVTSAGVLEIEEMELKLCKSHHAALTMFCKTDNMLICKDCTKQEHSNHEKQYMKVAAVPDTGTTVQNILDSMTASAFREFKRNLSHDYPECFETLPFDCSTQHVAEKLMRSFREEEILKVTLQLASVKKMAKIQEKVKEKFRRKFQHIHEGLALPKTQTVLHDIYTELYITEGGSDAIQNEHEVRQIEKATKNSTMQETPVKLNSIFKSSPEGDYIRLVLTKGVAGIGKTVSVQKFILDWAEDKENQDIDLILPLFFRDLNLEKGNDLSLMGLLQRYFPELRETETIENGIKILLILDGLDECRLPLDFQNARLCTDIMETTSMDVILTNLIKGNLLPNALLWITSRPAAVNQIPSECIQRVTEVRGFKDPQKQEYFRKKCTDPHLANEIIKIVKSSRSMQIMCHIPIFCWITATVLDILIRDSEVGEIPKNQTQLYTHFLFIQIGLKNRKYHRAMNEDLRKLNYFDKDMILRLAKIAFLELEKGNLVFYEEDLKDAGIAIDDASVFSSLCTQLFRQEFGLYEQKVFCFLHLSVQEHLAAIHVLYTYLSEGVNVLASHGCGGTQETTLTDVLKNAVNKALNSENGHFDQFLCFLVGLSTESSQKLLRGLLPQARKESYRDDEIVKFINDKICEENRKETETINLFHCLNEMGRNSTVKDIQEILQPDGRCDKELNIAQCSALAYVLVMSEDVVEVFDLKKYKTDASGQQRLLPVIRASKKAILLRCGLSAKACQSVASALRTVNSPLRELDLSHNNIGDAGVQVICESLKSPHCQLQILSLAACKITEKSCESLASALESAECRLTELDLSSNDLTNAGTKKLEPWLKQEQCTLRMLRLRQCRLTKQYCQSLAALTSSSTKQVKLDLSENELNDPEELQK